ncbi:MAG: ATP-binding protein [Gemmataceae bacterium]
MWEWISRLFDTSDFPARWHCGNWSSWHGWTHIVADMAIFAAYTAIPCVLAFFILRRRDVPFLPIFWLFVAFILFCGIGHLVEATIFWQPWYRLSASVKVATAVVSWATVLALIPIVPKALTLPGLAPLNERLRWEIAERKQLENRLRHVNEELEQRVQERTAELEQANDALNCQITERARAEQELRQIQEELEQRVAARTVELFQANQALDRQARQMRAMAEAAMVVNAVSTIPDVMQAITDQARHIIGAHQAVTSFTVDRNWTQAITGLSLSEKYAAYRCYDTKPDGSGIYSLVCENNQVIRLTQTELEAHPRWRGFGAEASRHPPMRGWLAAPLIRHDGQNQGLIQLSDKYEGEFTKEDELLLVQLAQLASVALQIRRVQEDLEQRVQERTAELVQANAALNQQIAERERAERDIREMNAFLDSVIEHVPLMLFLKDAETLRFTRLNRAGERMLGCDRETYIGKNDYDFFPAEQAEFFMAKDRETLQRQTLTDIPEEVIQTRHGLRILHTRKVPILDENGHPKCLLGISEDITQRKQTEQALRQLTRKLARSNTELEQFAYIASHDLQEPLRKVQAFGDIIMSQYEPVLGEEGRDYLRRMQNAAKRMQTLINDLLMYSRVTTKGQPFMRVDLNQVAQEVISDLEVRLRETKGQIEVEKLPVLEADPLQMRQLLQNLLGNALKFHRPDEPPQVKVQASLLYNSEREQDSTAPVPSKCLLTIQDNGVGFEEKYLDRIFGPFQRLHGRGEYEGSGMGLAICHKIVLRHGGNITACSTPDQGSTFIVTLPLKHSEGESVS